MLIKARATGAPTSAAAGRSLVDDVKFATDLKLVQGRRIDRARQKAVASVARYGLAVWYGNRTYAVPVETATATMAGAVRSEKANGIVRYLAMVGEKMGRGHWKSGPLRLRSEVWGRLKAAAEETDDDQG